MKIDNIFIGIGIKRMFIIWCGEENSIIILESNLLMFIWNKNMTFKNSYFRLIFPQVYFMQVHWIMFKALYVNVKNGKWECQKKCQESWGYFGTWVTSLLQKILEWKIIFPPLFLGVLALSHPLESQQVSHALVWPSDSCCVGWEHSSQCPTCFLSLSHRYSLLHDPEQLNPRQPEATWTWERNKPISYKLLINLSLHWA